MNRSICALVVLLLASTLLAAPSPKLSLPGWDRPVDPDKDCKIRRSRDSLTVEMPGTVHDFNLQAKRANAPRLMRDFDGDFEIQFRSRIDCRASAESSVKGQPSYVSAGFLVVPPDNNYFIRSEYRAAGQGDGAGGYFAFLDLGAVRGGTYNDIGQPVKMKSDSIYHRLERWGNSLLFSVSLDGEKWGLAGGSNRIGRSSKLKVGLLACSTSTDPSKVLFDQIKILPPRKRGSWEFTSGWGKPVDPDKDCKIQREKDSLTIEMPGSDHDYDPFRKRLNAPRLLSDLEGDFDLELRVRIDYLPSDKSTVKGQPPFVSAGFLLMYPDTNRTLYRRVEFAVSQQGSSPDAYAEPAGLAQLRRKNPAPKGMDADGYCVMKKWIGMEQKANRIEWDRGTLKPWGTLLWERGWEKFPLPEKADYAYLRLDRRGLDSMFFLSADGEKWTPLTCERNHPGQGKLALAAYSTSPGPSRVRFDQLKLRRGEKK